MVKKRKQLVFTKHADVAIAERNLKREWIDRAVHAPEWESMDPTHRDVVRRFLTIAERDDRILRVVCLETDNEIRILTAFFDRRASRLR